MRRLILLVGAAVVGVLACGDDTTEGESSSGDPPGGPSCESFCASLEDVANCGSEEAVPICTQDCNATAATCPNRSSEVLACLAELTVECVSPGVMVAKARGTPAATPAVIPIEHGSITVEDAVCSELAEKFVTCTPGMGGTCESITTLIDDFEGTAPGSFPTGWEGFCDSDGAAATADTTVLACGETMPMPAGGESAYGAGLRLQFDPPIDASSYHGLRLRLLVNDASLTVRISFGTAATVLPPEGTCGEGVCDPSNPAPCPGCNDHFGVERTLQMGVNDVVVPLSEVVQQGFGEPPMTFDPTAILHLTVQGPVDATFQFGIEELGWCN